MCSLAFCFATVRVATAAEDAPRASPRRVLIIHSFGRDFAPLATMSATFRTELARQSPEPVEFFEASIESARFAEGGNDAPLVNYLKALFAERQLDLIVTVAEPATHFAVRQRTEFFPDTPLLAHVDHRQLSIVTAATNATIMPVYIRIPVLLENILQVLPETTNVVMVLGASPFERVWANQCRQEFAPFTNRVSISYVNDLPLDQIRKTVATMPPRSVILYAMLAVDAAGVPYEQEKALAGLSAAANAPLFGVFESQLGHGIVGGPLLRLEESGKQAARTALALLRGQKSSEMKIPGPEPASYIYDWRQLERWKIKAERLPAGSEVRFRARTFWEDHKQFILIASAVILVQMVTIAALLVHRARRRRSEAALRESEQRLNLAARAANLGIWVWEIPRDEVWMSEAGRGVFGWTGAESINFERFIGSLHLEDQESTRRAVQKALNGEGDYETEYRVLVGDGAVRWIAARGQVEFNSQKKPVRLSGVAADITARKAAEAESQQQRAELAHVARVSTMGELAASLAHELNQPLGAILSNAEAAEMFLKQTPPALGDVREILADIRKDDERAGEVIRRMRALLRKRETQMQPLDLNSVVNDVLRMISGDAALRKVGLSADLWPQLPMVRGDRVHLQQVLLNLTMNAMEAMTKQPPHRSKLSVCTHLNGRATVELTVTDGGPGIELEKLSRIFDPFFTTKANGMGMGLSIARRIVEAHGGTIAGENHPKGGAVFRVALPVAKETGRL